MRKRIFVLCLSFIVVLKFTKTPEVSVSFTETPEVGVSQWTSQRQGFQCLWSHNWQLSLFLVTSTQTHCFSPQQLHRWMDRWMDGLFFIWPTTWFFGFTRQKLRFLLFSNEDKAGLNNDETAFVLCLFFTHLNEIIPLAWTRTCILIPSSTESHLIAIWCCEDLK